MRLLRLFAAAEPFLNELMATRMKITILGLSITSSWGNGHATIFRALVRELDRRGHDVWFLERDKPWYARSRDLPDPPHGRTFLYDSIDDLKDRFAQRVRESDLVVVGSYVPEGVHVGQWAIRTTQGLAAFYDIDTPVTLSKLARGDHEYLTPELIPQYGLYLSFTGGPTLDLLEERYGSPCARPLYCCVDAEAYHPDEAGPPGGQPTCDLDLGYMGTWSEDRQPPLDRLMLRAAAQWPEGRFLVAGPQYPDTIRWPANVDRIDHLPPAEHVAFYHRQRFTLNITRADMIRAGYAPSVRLFEAGACATPVISDAWPGLETFFVPGEEILISRGPDETLRYLREMPADEARAIGRAARDKVLAHHTAARRAEELERYAQERCLVTDEHRQ